MPRPKGSKNKKTLAQNAACITAEQIAKDKALIAEEIEAAEAAVSEAMQLVKEKKAALKAAQKKLARFLKQEASMTALAEKAQRKADAEKLAQAFLSSGKSLDEVMELLK